MGSSVEFAGRPEDGIAVRRGKEGAYRVKERAGSRDWLAEADMSVACRKGESGGGFQQSLRYLELRLSHLQL
jgi:hypothetical protein